MVHEDTPMLSPIEIGSKEKKEQREKAPTPENHKPSENDRKNSGPKRATNAEKLNIVRTAVLAPLRRSKMSQNKVRVQHYAYCLEI